MNSVTQSHYSIEEIIGILGIKSYLLRFWESEFEELGPLISDDGNRIYTPRDLAILKKVKHLLMVEKQSLYKAKSLISQEFDLFGTSSISEEVEETELADFEDNTIELDSYPEEREYETLELVKSEQTDSPTEQSIAPSTDSESRPILKAVEPEISTETRLEIIKQNNAALTEAQQHAVKKLKNMNEKKLELLSKASELLTHTKKSIHLFKLKLEVL